MMLLMAILRSNMFYFDGYISSFQMRKRKETRI
jgi:hypothetical protein